MIHYVIDAYNLFFRFQNEAPTPSSKQAFIETFSNAMSGCQLQGMLVFDCNYFHAQKYPSHEGTSSLKVVLAPAGTTADEYILEFLRARKNPALYTLVSSDKFLTNSAKSLGCATLSIEDFLSLLETKEKKISRKKSLEKPHCDSNSQLKRLEKIFTDRFNSQD